MTIVELFCSEPSARFVGGNAITECCQNQKGMTAEEFMRSYCYRVVIEGIISAMKNIFGVLVRSRKRHNQDVEVLSRMVLWNYINIEPGSFRSTLMFCKHL